MLFKDHVLLLTTNFPEIIFQMTWVFFFVQFCCPLLSCLNFSFTEQEVLKHINFKVV